MLAKLLLAGFEVAFIQIGEEAVLMRKRVRVILSKKGADGYDKSVAIISEAEVIEQDPEQKYLARLKNFWEQTYP